MQNKSWMCAVIGWWNEVGERRIEEGQLTTLQFEGKMQRPLLETSSNELYLLNPFDDQEKNQPGSRKL